MFTSPKFIAGMLGGVVIGAAGSTLLLFSNKETSSGLRRKLATTIRDMADKAIENIDKAAQEVEDKLEGEDEGTSKASSQGGGRRQRTEQRATEQSVN